ncbi:sulfurtransferase-like selenium metabolism protein YedF [Eggerthella sp. NSJ-70]|uniref:Sulfurtransferase-like selenium metabolism protein YedF n=1 Tax=Eggerthella hominis TaxID=2763043 RepID=A0ABR7BN81_9ACTN|nr:sulfurtransferase-like selenium metabolism protein YedF [Eggerthella hominis]MBC5583068.1 sulfurtransferase-like selenium metabolism protein YedF [Eggerthella hominis]
MEQIDARGQACPLPVVRAKKALAAMEEGVLEVLVDNRIAVHNLEALAKTLKVEAVSDERGEAAFAVTFAKGATAGDGTAAGADAAAAVCPAVQAAPTGGVVAVIPSEFMGSGDDELGAVLMKGFVFALTQLDELPATVLMYNGGVKLACAGSSSLDDLRALAEAGVEIMSCGTCLNHYGLADRLEVGEATNMYVIVDKQANARGIIRP